MKKSVFDYIKEVKRIQVQNTELHNIIDQKTKKFEESISGERQALLDNAKTIKKLKNMQLRAEIPEIRNQLAQVWNTTPDNIAVTVTTTLDRISGGQSIDDYMKEVLTFRNVQYNFLLVDFNMVAEDGKTISKTKQIQIPFSFAAPQRDGKKFLNHLVPSAEPVSEGSNLKHMSLQFDNIDDLILDFSVQTAMYVLEDNRDETGNAILKAMDVYNQRQNEQEMAD